MIRLKAVLYVEAASVFSRQDVESLPFMCEFSAVGAMAEAKRRPWLTCSVVIC